MIGSASAVAIDLPARTWRDRARDQPLIPLLILLLCLVILLLAVQPGLLGRPHGWISTTIRLATPLAILGACQTLTMLTGGIDLSVAAVASAAGFVMASQAPAKDLPSRSSWRSAWPASWASSTASGWASSASSR
jgi:ribose/xylose/arabinose/galactoside ABC-type transport system permease subunit